MFTTPIGLVHVAYLDHRTNTVKLDRFAMPRGYSWNDLLTEATKNGIIGFLGEISFEDNPNNSQEKLQEIAFVMREYYDARGSNLENYSNKILSLFSNNNYKEPKTFILEYRKEINPNCFQPVFEIDFKRIDKTGKNYDEKWTLSFTAEQRVDMLVEYPQYQNIIENQICESIHKLLLKNNL